MRTGAAAGHRGFFHEAAFHHSDEEFLAVVVPFLTGALAAGEPAVAAFAPVKQGLLRDALGPRSGVLFIDGDAQYARPAVAIRQYRQLFADLVMRGATQIRVSGDVPHPGVGVPWEWWARYEAAVNNAWDDFPVWGLCPYDTRITPAGVLEQVRRTHPFVAAGGGHHRNPAYQDPHGFLRGVEAWRDPLEHAPPAVELCDPDPGAARDAVAALRQAARIGEDDLQGLLLSVSEAVTNALMHGRAPVRLRAWTGPGRLVVTVTDTGAGPVDPMTGLVPAAGPGGMGMWLAHQLCAYVSLQRAADGFTIRLVAGRLGG
ncbi:sensor histidine kinase [Catellatospora sp. NPDC049609]|uniref:sensor histidine kinase n=1 Tax=Catellatospora sp. NPDC049609 TaxID=3155505 RepID=UPI0034317986